ncbi:MAG: hypothetical protein U9Q68_02615 [Euryarchaeota archaeon]|nr:hypothetical protein [Euryarchaeota archaeon]
MIGRPWNRAAELIWEQDKKITYNMSESEGMDIDRILSIILIIAIVRYYSGT